MLNYHLLSLVYLGKVTFKGQKYAHFCTEQAILAFLSRHHAPQKAILLVNPRFTLSSQREEKGLSNDLKTKLFCYTMQLPFQFWKETQVAGEV